MTENIGFTPEFEKRLEAAINRGVFRATELVREEILRRILQDAKSGRIYMRRSVAHQASAPGEAPASDTGNLVRLITTRYFPDQFLGQVVSSAEYARSLEYGSSRVAPRPHMRVSLETKRVEVEQAISDEIRVELER